MCSHRIWSGISLNSSLTKSVSKLFLKLYLKSIFHLLLIYNHAIADGISGVILTNQILESYSKLRKNETLDSTCTRVKTIAKLKSDDMPNGDANIRKLTDYANKVSWKVLFNYHYNFILRKTMNSKITWRVVHLIRMKKKVSLSDKDRKKVLQNSKP